MTTLRPSAVVGAGVPFLRRQVILRFEFNIILLQLGGGERGEGEGK